MKLFSFALALGVAQTAAFTVQPSTTAPTTALNADTGRYETSAARGTLSAKTVWDASTPTTVQGGALRTWSFTNPPVERVQVLMKSDGRPLHANVELWEGPDNTPQRLGIYIEEGSLRPFSAVIETPRPGANAVAIYNTAMLEFPLAASVEADVSGSTGSGIKMLSEMSVPRLIQGGSINTYPFAPTVESVQILLQTDGRPLNARVELLQGPSNNKQVIEIYTEDGLERPFFAVIETPGVGNVVRIINAASVEFPLTAFVEPYLLEPGAKAVAQTDTWDNGEGSSFLLSPPL